MTAAPRWLPTGGRLTDALCVAAITAGSTLPYLPHLGFYSDDWALLAQFDAAERDGSRFALTAATFPARPVQWLYLALLFRSFGFDPLGYHIVNSAVLATGTALLYLLLLRLRFGPVLAFAAALLFVMLPQLSTVRVWYAIFQIPLSMTLTLISMHAQLSLRDSGKLMWLAAAVVAAALSLAAYEIFAPLLAGFAVAIAVGEWRKSYAGSAVRRHITIAATGIVAVVLAAATYKAAFSGRTGELSDLSRYLAGLRQLVRLDYDWRVDSSLNVFAMARVYFWAPIRGWWEGAILLVTGRSGLLVTAIAVGVAAVGWWRLAAGRIWDTRQEIRLLLLGIATFLLGHATFLLVPSITFSVTGVGNRGHVAAAVGAAMIFASLIALGAGSLPKQYRGLAIAAAIAVASATGFARLAHIERYWAQAPDLQERIIGLARIDLRNLPDGSTVILDGICPYHGPAVVFEADWDVGGALSLALRRRILGDVVSPRMSVTARGLETSIYGSPNVYPYSDRLFVYDPGGRLLVRLPHRAAAERYFAAREQRNCPRGFVARGVEV